MVLPTRESIPDRLTFYPNENMKTTAIAIALHLFILMGGLGLWGANLYRLVKCDFEPSYKAEVIYGIGIFTPTFIVTAWMDID